MTSFMIPTRASVHFMMRRRSSPSLPASLPEMGTRMRRMASPTNMAQPT